MTNLQVGFEQTNEFTAIGRAGWDGNCLGSYQLESKCWHPGMLVGKIVSSSGD